MGNSNPRSVSLWGEWLLGDRYTRVSSKRGCSGVIWYGELESEVRFPRTQMVARQPRHPDFIEKGLPWGNSTWWTQIWGPFPSKTHKWTGNQWESSSRETSFPDESPCGKHQSGSQTHRKSYRGSRILFEIWRNLTRIVNIRLLNQVQWVQIQV